MRPRGGWGDLMLKLALQRLSVSVVKLTTEAGSHATARRLGDLRQAKTGTICPRYQREQKRAPHASRYPPKTGQILPPFSPLQSLYIVRYDGRPKRW